MHPPPEAVELVVHPIAQVPRPVELVREQGDAEEHEQQARPRHERQAQRTTTQQQDESGDEPDHAVGRLDHAWAAGSISDSKIVGMRPRHGQRSVRLDGRRAASETRPAMDAREKILETAMRLFSAQGYANTSLSQVAKDAEVSKALIFWHFESKDKLFRAVVQRTLEPYFINVVDDLEGLSEADQIVRLVDEFYAFVSRNLDSVRFFLSLILRDDQHPQDVVGHMNELQRVYLRLVADVIESGRQRGVFRESVQPALQAQLIMCALYGVLVQGFIGGEQTPGAALLDHLKATLVDTLRRDG
jgi:AcrR family transcriptional regulator